MPERIAYPFIPASEVQISENAPIMRAVEIIDRTRARIALVVDGEGRPVGSLTDGDVRRGLLHGQTLESPVKNAMHRDPAVLKASSGRQQIVEHMRTLQVKQMPLVDDGGKLAGIAVYDMLTGFERVPRTNPVVIMAGGVGKRLMPLTSEIPKPMVEIGGKAILERILEQFIKQGFSRFHIAINYLGHVIEDHFGDGSKWNSHITYVREPEFLGTAGALSLVEGLDESFLVINGDILTSVDFGGLLDYHVESGGTATVCARTHRVEVPYGVIQLKNGTLETIVEKPVYEDLISAGIYAFEPEVMQFLSRGKVVQMPDLLRHVVQRGRRVAVFPMNEDWTDVGHHDDLDRVKRSFEKK